MRTKRRGCISKCFGLLFFYVCAYGFARWTESIVHLELRGGEGHRVVARTEAWDDAISDLVEGKGKAGKALSRGRDRIPDFMDFVFSPLRKLEVMWWDRQAE